MTTPSLTPRPLCSREREGAGNEFRLPLKKSTTVKTYLNAVCSKCTCVVIMSKPTVLHMHIVIFLNDFVKSARLI